jgi:mannitol/fructose-specific phosphotransferase system IIA component (Ntr-type)
MELLSELTLLEENVLFFEPSNAHEIISALVGTLSDKLLGRDSFVIEKVLERESIVPTAIGKSIALPHGRIPFLEDFIMAIGVCKGGAVWQTLDNEPVKIICLLLGPSNKPSKYLHFLSFITSILNEEEIRLNILKEEDKKNIVNIFLNC